LVVGIEDVLFAIWQFRNRTNTPSKAIVNSLCHKSSLGMCAPAHPCPLNQGERNLLRERTNGLEESMELLNRVQKLLLQGDVSSDIKDNDLFVQARCETLGFRLRVTVTDSAFIVCAHLGLYCPIYRRAAMYEAISRANWQLRLSRLEMDSQDGELRLRADMPLYGAELTDDQIRRLISCVWSNAEIYAPALLQLMTTEIEPSVAIERVEGGSLRSSESEPVEN
jgi:hypothetical protein